MGDINWYIPEPEEKPGDLGAGDPHPAESDILRAENKTLKKKLNRAETKISILERQLSDIKYKCKELRERLAGHKKTWWNIFWKQNPHH